MFDANTRIITVTNPSLPPIGPFKENAKQTLSLALVSQYYHVELDSSDADIIADMQNARLVQQELAGFDLNVQLGRIAHRYIPLEI